MAAYERRDFAGAAVPATLEVGINGSDLTIIISDASGWPTGSDGDFFIVIDRVTAANPNGVEEKARVADLTGTTLTVQTAGRGVDGTSAASHSSGVSVEHCLTAQDLDEANYAVAQTVGKVTTAGDLLVGTGLNALARLAKGANSTVLGVSSGGTQQYAQVATGQIADNAVTADKIPTSVAGNGLAGGGGTALSVTVDDSTIEIAADTVQVKDGGITADQLATSVAGAGITGGEGTPLALVVDNSTVEVNVDTLRVKAGGITANEIAANAVGSSELADDAVDTGAIAANAVTTVKIADANVTLAKLASEAWTAFTPTLVQSGAVTKTVTYARYVKIGRTIHAQIVLTVTGSGTGNNDIVIGLPVTAASGTTRIIGDGSLFDNDGNIRYHGQAQIISTTTFDLLDGSGNHQNPMGVDPNVALGADDVIVANIMYESAA